MPERFQEYDSYITSIDVKGDGIPDSKNENHIKDLAKDYLKQAIPFGITGPESNILLNKIKILLQRQDIEKINLKESLKEQVKSETREKLDKETRINEARIIIYENLGINDNMRKNSSMENFLKGITDELVIGNYELAIEIINTNGKVLLDSLKHIANWEGIKSISKSLGKSIWDLFAGDAYERGKSVAQLGLISTGISAGFIIGKKGLKYGMKQSLKHGGGKELLTRSSKLGAIIEKTNAKVAKLIPKKSLDFEKALVDDIAKLGDPERLQAGSFFLKRKLNPKQGKALLDAHDIGALREGSGMHNYSLKELKSKIAILKKAGFSDSERRILLEKGVCGKISKERMMQIEQKGDSLKQKVDNMYKLAESTRDDFDNLLLDVGNKSHASKILDSQKVPLKSKESVMSKIENDIVGGGKPERICDILRGSIVYDSISDLRSGLEMLQNSGKVKKLYINERLGNPLTNDVLVNVKFKNGFVTEVQLHIKETLSAKEIGLKLDKNIIDLMNHWTENDYKILSKLKNGEYQGRSLNEEIRLPKSNADLTSGHHMYEIRRSIPPNPSYELQEFYNKVTNIERAVFEQARKQYEIRTGTKFNR